MGLKEDALLYREPITRMVVGVKNPGDHSCDNGLLFSAEYLMLLPHEDLGSEREWFQTLVTTCEVMPGLIRRYPGDPGYEAHDDYIGTLAGLWLLQSSLRFAFLDYGKTNWWLFNNVDPGKPRAEQWLGRFPIFPVFVKAACDQPLGWLDQWIWLLTLIYGVFADVTGDTSSKILQWLMNQTVTGKGYKLIDFGLWFWKKRMLANVPGGMQQVFAIYFNPEHPFAKYARKDFE